MLEPKIRSLPRAEGIDDQTPEAPPGFDTGIETLMGWGSWIVIAICGVAILVAAGRMAMAHKSGADGGQHLTGLIWVVVAAVMAGSAAALVQAFIITED
ncbi:hypothetical protein OG216_38190 [Streptomycetaceae bacterium NBC_01309]